MLVVKLPYFSNDEDLTPFKIAFYQDVYSEEVYEGEMLLFDEK